MYSHYFAVTTIDIYGGEEKEVRAVPLESKGPEIDDIKFNGTPLSDGDIINAPGTVTLNATDPSGMECVEFEVVGQRVYTANGDGPLFSWFWPLSESDNGNHTLTITARDVYRNTTYRAFNLIVAIEAPPDPVDTLSVDWEGDGISATANWAGYDEPGQSNVSGYRIYAETDPYSDIDGLTAKAEVPAGLFTHTLKNLARNTTYWIAVAAFDANGNANPSVAPVYGITVDTIPPEDVSALASKCCEDCLVFSWNHSPDSMGDLHGYHVYFDGSDTAEVLESTQNSFERCGLSPSRSYPVKVTAFDNDGNESSGKTMTGATLLDNPADIVATPGNETVILNWNPVSPADLVKCYAVYISQTDFSTVEGMEPAKTTPKNYTTISGLSNDKTYYFAVTTRNISDGERKQVHTVSAILQTDTQGPEIGDVRINGTPIGQGHVIVKGASISVIASDPSGIGRVEFLIDGVLSGTDYSGSPANFYWDVSTAEDKDYHLTIVAFDSLENGTTLEYTVTVAVEPPEAPQITTPVSGTVFNQSSIMVSGTAEKNTEILLFNNGNQAGDTIRANANGAFSGTAVLIEGENILQAAAKNRAGTGPLSADVVVTLDTNIPESPIDLSAKAVEGGAIKLSWKEPPGIEVAGYNLYRSNSEFTTASGAERLNNVPVKGKNFTDLPSHDGAWYYRISSETAAGNESPLSNQASAVADSVMPRAISISYTPLGIHDPVTGRTGPGKVELVLTASEPLVTIPFLSVTPEMAMPIMIALKKDTETLFSGSFEIGETTKSGTAWAVFSGRDPAGNRGTEIDAGQTLLIDTEGPVVRRIEMSPTSPVKNDEQSPATVTVTVGLNEKMKPGTTPELSYKLSGSTNAIPVHTVGEIPAVAGDTQTWQAQFVLPADAGLTSPETLSFIYQGTDDLENQSDEIACPNAFQIYQGDLPPLEPPTGLTAKALPEGAIELSWNEVENAADYQIYRQGPGQTELIALVRSAGSTGYVDHPPEDGTYLYTVATVRSENGQESVGSACEPVSAVSDSIAPETPFGLVLELVSQGIRASWEQYEPDPPEDITFNLYRSDRTEITDTEGLVPVSTKISGLTAVDAAASTTEHCYAVTAVDAAGNESGVSLSQYLNFDLLPVSNLCVERTDDQPPVVSWTHPAGNIKGFDIYLGTGTPGERGTKLNDVLLTGPSFTDIGFSGDSRGYTVVAVDENLAESMGRSIFLPLLEFDLSEGSNLKRSIMNRMEFTVDNLSEEPVENALLRITVAGRQHVSAYFDLSPGALETVPVVVGGYADLQDLEDAGMAVEIAPHEDEIVRISRSREIEVGDGRLVLQVFNEAFTRGATGTVWFSLENTGDAQIEIITAENSGAEASGDIRFEILDSDGNALAGKAFMQALGDGVLTDPEGRSVARIDPGKTFVSAPVQIPVPSGAPETVFASVSISTLYHHLGEEDQIEMEGISADHRVTLKKTSYFGLLTGITPERSRGDQDVEISGKALERTTSTPLGRVPLAVAVTENDFERTFEVFTDENGEFILLYKPSTGDAGVHCVSVLHPDVTDRTVHGTFTIDRVRVSPELVKLDIPVNHEQPVNIDARVSEGLAVDHLRLAYEATDQPGQSFVEGVHVTCGPAVGHVEGEKAALSFTIRADDSAPESADMVLRVVSDGSVNDPWAMVTVKATFSKATPRLEVTPERVDTGVVRGESVAETVGFKNSGFENMENVRIELTDTNGGSVPDWILPGRVKSLGDIEIGKTKQAGLVFSPTGSTPEGLYEYVLHVTSDNYPEAMIGVRVAVTRSGTGNALIKVSDIYTGTVDPDTSRIIEGLSNASVTLQNEAVSTEVYTARTDEAGEALFSDLPAGLYACRVSADRHKTYSGTVKIRPGVTSSESVFLMNQLVTVEWSVTETTIGDTYKIEAKATFETDVPAPVIVFEPAGIVLPPGMEAGDIYRGEFTMTNQGLVCADNIRFELPENDPYFTYELADGLPKTLEAKESVVVAYRVICLKSLTEDATDASGGHIECKDYMYKANVKTIVEGKCSDGISRDFYFCQNIAIPFQFCYEVDEDGNIVSATEIQTGAANVVTTDYGVVNWPECTGADCILCWANSPQYEIEIDKCAMVEALTSGSDPVEAVTLKVITPYKELQILKETVVPLEKTGSSVDPLGGEYIRSHTDLTVKVPGGKIKVSRVYIRNKWFLDPFRTKMIDPGAARLEFRRTGGIVEEIVRNKVIYGKKADGLWGHRDIYSIIETPDGYRWQDKFGRYEDYDESGFPTASGDADGPIVNAVYEPQENGRLMGYTDKNGSRVIWFSYNADGLISAVYDAEGRGVEYEYENGLPVRVIDVRGYASLYEYDNQCRLLSATDPSGNEIKISYDRSNRVGSVIDSAGNGKYFEYSFNDLQKQFYTKIKTTGGVVKEMWFDNQGDTSRIDINGETVKKIEKQGNTLLITDASGGVVKKEYDEWDNLKKVVYPDGASVQYEYDLRFNKPTRLTDEKGVVHTYEYDDSGNPTKKTRGAGSPDEQITEYDYDDMGNVTAIRRLKGGGGPYAIDAEVTRTYDTYGNKTSETDAGGNTTFFTYDTAGNMISRKDPNGHRWQYSWDDSGNLLSTTDPLGNQTFHEYDADGRMVKRTDARGNETTFAYDERGRVVSVTDAYGNSIFTEYDTDGNVVSITDREGKRAWLEYDEKGRLVKTIDGKGNVIEQVYADYASSSCPSCSVAPSDLPVKTIYPTFAKEFAYDERGRKILETDILSQDDAYETVFEYDLSGNLASQTDKELNTTRYVYDDLNRLRKVVDPMEGETIYSYDARNNLISLTDANGGTTRFEYDKNNRLVKEIRPMGQETTYNYDPSGNLIEKIDAKNQKTEYEYNAANRLIRLLYYDSADHQNPVKTVDFDYDPSGNLTGYSDGITSAAYSYDDLNRKTGETIDYGNFTLYYGYTYCHNGMKKSFTGPDGIEYAYTYDNNNQLASVNIPATGSITVNEYQWYHPTKITLPGGTTKNYDYDPLMRVRNISSYNPAGNLLVQNDYEYDKMDNIMEKQTEQGTYVYDYDKLYRLTMADNPALTDEFYTYDPVGNRLTSSDYNDCSYNANNELQGYDGVFFDYDENGNMVQKTAGSEITRYIYNVENRLESVEDTNGTVIAAYYYDPFGRRLWKEVSGTRAFFLYAEEGLIGEYDEDGIEIKTYGWKLGGIWTTDPLFMKIGTSYYFYHNDHLGTPQRMTATNGAVVWNAKYSSFGKSSVEVEMVENNLRFPGQYYDEETGLHYNLNLYYDPSTGRYLTPDPIGLDGGINLFAYVQNNPVRFIDPKGLMVYQCFRKADIPFNENIGLPHTWLKTDTKEAGLGPADGRIPGVGPQKDSPYVSDTMIVDHTGESQRSDAWCVPLPNVPEDCVNDRLEIGKPRGKWNGFNQCWNFVESIKIDCQHRCMK